MKTKRSTFAAALIASLCHFHSPSFAGDDNAQDSEASELMFLDSHFRNVISKSIASTHANISFDETAPDGTQRRMCYVGVTTDKTWQGSGFFISINPKAFSEPC